MKDEIKEILDKLRETADYPKLNYSSYDKSYNETIDNVAMIKSFACKQLLDYITNLQEKYDKALEDSVKETHKLMAIRKYLKDNEREYGSLEDNEKIILGIIEGE